ncbi:MAG: hypothetical protein KGV59_02555 [Tenacibaculum sp.]|nr:hypothetical protein [Tenacibaculum sp.]
MSRKDISNIVLDKSKNTEVKTLKHEDFIAGIAPYLRGIYSTMYVLNPWDINQYLNFSEITKKNVINNVDDMKDCLSKISIKENPISFNMDENILPFLAFYIIASEEQGIKQQELKGIIQNNIFTFPLSYSIKIIKDIIEYTNKNIPDFNPISIAGYKIQEDKTTEEIELAHSLAYAINYIKKGLKIGLNIDELVSNISLTLSVGINHFREIAKLRACRMLWAHLIKEFNPKEKSLALKIHCKTNDYSLTKQDIPNNITRTVTKTMAGILGGVQSSQTNSFNKKIQLYLQQETNITKTIDPWAGSYHLEQLTEDIYNKTLKIINETENLDGITKVPEKEIKKISNNTLNCNKTDKNRFKRDENNVKKSLENLTESIESGKGNLLHLAVISAKNRATLNEILSALKSVD